MLGATLPTLGAAVWDNSCLARPSASLVPPTVGAPATFLPHCAAWVVNTTDAVWLPSQTDAQVRAALRESFYEDWASTSNGRSFRGMATLESLVFATKRAFPDLRIHITDVACVGNDVDGYKTIMPDVLQGTHAGDSATFGPPTGRRASWSGMALCYVQKVGGRWQYVAEWVVHDELSAAMQLGRLPWVAANATGAATAAAAHDCAPNAPSWGWQPPAATTTSLHVTDAERAEERHTLAAGFATPAAKQVVEAMDALISAHISTYDWPAWREVMAPFWTADAVYDSTLGTGGRTVGLHEWFFSEHVRWNDAFSPAHFSQLIFAGDAATATTTTYGTVVWRGAFAGVAPTNATHTIRISDYYQMETVGDQLRIATNWMMLDVADLCRASGRRVLPRAAALPDDGAFLPPMANDGVPAPLSVFTPPEARAATRAAVERLLALEWDWRPAGGGAGAGVVGGAADGLDSGVMWDKGMVFYGPSGIGLARGYSEYSAHVLAPRRAAFEARSFELDVLSCEGAYCGAHGHLRGTHAGCYLGAWPKAGGRAEVRMRVGLHWHVVDGVARTGYMMHDAPALFADHFDTDLLARAASADPLPPACPIAATTAVALAAVDVAPAIAANPALVFGVGVLGAAATILFAAGLHAARSRDGLSALRSPLLRANK